MTLFAFALLADENINPEVVSGLRALGCQIVTVAELGLAGAADSLILKRAVADGRIVITHDPDFGRLALQGSAISTGVVFLRPGHISSGIVLANLEAANTAAGDLSTPFLLTVEQKSQSGLRIRVRQLPIGG